MTKNVSEISDQLRSSTIKCYSEVFIGYEVASRSIKDDRQQLSLPFSTIRLLKIAINNFDKSHFHPIRPKRFKPQVEPQHTQCSGIKIKLLRSLTEVGGRPVAVSQYTG